MIVVVGSLNMDLVARVDHQPAPGETLIATGFARHHGGKGANQAVAVARAGAATRMIGAVGHDAFAAEMAEGLVGERVDVAHLQHVSGPSGMALITVDANGENQIVVVPGANGQCRAEALQATMFAGASVVMLQLEIELPTVRRAAELGRAAGATVILNAAPATALEATDIDSIDWLIVNTVEAGQILGSEPAETADDALQQAKRLTDDGQRAALITLGGAGAVWVSGGDNGRVAAIQSTVVDTTAAGDAFVGAFAAALDAGRTPRDAVTRAVAAGALAVRVAGARAGLPTAAEVDELMARKR